MKIRLTVDVDADAAAKLERYDRAIYDMSCRAGIQRLHGRPYVHDPKRVVEALVLDGIVGLDDKIAAINAKAR